MPTNKPRYNLTIDGDLLERITRYQCDNAIGSMNAAIIELVTIGLSASLKETIPQVFSKEELYLINAFRQAPASIRSQFMSLINSSLLLARDKRRREPMHDPECDLLSVMAGYELSDAETRTKIDELITDALMRTLSASDPIAGESPNYADIRETARAARQNRVNESDQAKAE